ncbi:hypothetical protein [Prochlorococcus marinus]|uniref:Putative BdrC3 n=1 Tax=Prochlorococcus marinus str. GP2 TaxID=59925 RepID=A0A0A1ZGY7_PROMR|nr:hypothetical protein [Prochlorococcus marinus]KGF87816.1 putative BdrC3 [Prochlorococcus marinus str. GP2]
MPTKKKRVGFIPREDVLKIIDRLSLENNLSNSKIISILVEEALSMRGMFNKKNSILTQINKKNNKDSENFSEASYALRENDKFKINTKVVNHKNPMEGNFLNQANNEDFDLHIYKKFLTFLKFQKMMDEYNN